MTDERMTQTQQAAMTNNLTIIHIITEIRQTEFGPGAGLPRYMCNTFVYFSCNIFYVSICPLRFETVENKSWPGSISYIQICI